MHLHEIERMLRRFGYELRRRSSTHRHYFNDRGQRVTVALSHTSRTLSPLVVSKLRTRLERDAAQGSVG